MTTKIVNLTPHPVRIRLEDGSTYSSYPAGLARVSSTSVALGALEIESPHGDKIMRVPVFATHFGTVEGLPDPVEGTIYVTSALVAEAATRAGRTDVFAPGTGPNDGAIRDESQRVEAVTRLVRVGG
jgi:hypothetical protein